MKINKRYTMGLSNAVPQNDVSRIVGYQLTTGNFATISPNLPQCIAILAEMNDANQATPLTPTQITSAKQAGDLYGYGSPVYNIARILFPIQGGGSVQAPVWVYPQLKAAGATNTQFEISASGVATANGTHYINLCGRESLDGTSYAINIVVGDNSDTISVKIYNAIANVLGCPVTASENPSPYSSTFTTKWSGLTSNDVNATVDTQGNSLGLTYTITPLQSGSGTPDINAALALFGNQWNTIVINSYGLVPGVMNELETFNGIPSATAPTGRYSPTVFLPFYALSGTNLPDPSSITSPRSNQCTIVTCPCPNSPGMQMEAAANCAKMAANTYQNTPNLDICGQFMPDMPVPSISVGIGAMASYDNRNAILKAGSSTVNVKNQQYKIEDFVTTWAPTGENPPQFRYVRNIDIDWNVRFQYLMLEAANVRDHQIANDGDSVSAPGVIKPKMWNALLQQLATSLVSQGLIVDAAFMQASITVAISSTNPDRFETFFKYKRSGFARVLSTTAQAGFNFGNL
jgi:phage tail sheath gpL-like